MDRFHNSTLPFEEFAAAVFARATLLSRSEKNDLARSVADEDWSDYSNHRDGRCHLMSDILKTGQLTERLHVGFVRQFFPLHDHSKDDFYVLVCTLRFRVPNFDVKMYPETVAFAEQEFQRHYRCEAHHPEIEMLTNHECTESEVEETAVDRMARNFQFSADGTGDAAMLRRYQPRWTKNTERNEKIYNSYVEENYAVIGAAWRDYIARF